MYLNFIGDGARYFKLGEANTSIKNDVNRLALQLSSGEIADKPKALGGDTVGLSTIDHGLSVVDAQVISNRETEVFLGAMQRMLSSVNDQRGALASTLLPIRPDSSQIEVSTAIFNASEQFATMITTLNGDHAGSRLLSGTAVDQAPLADADVILADLVTAIGGATDFATIETAINDWFDTPGGGFETVGYLGDDGDLPVRRLDENRVASVQARADSTEMRALLKGAAMAALVNELPGLTRDTQTEMLFEGGLRLQAAAQDVVDVQARIGFLEGEVERTLTAQLAEQTALRQVRNDLVADDPFETASALQAAQLQLETHYTMTARLSQLSLVNYLR